MGLEILKRKKFNGDHSFRTQGCKTAKTLRRKTLTVVSFLSTHDKKTLKPQRFMFIGTQCDLWGRPDGTGHEKISRGNFPRLIFPLIPSLFERHISIGCADLIWDITLVRLDQAKPFLPRDDPFDLSQKLFLLCPHLRQLIAECGNRHLLIHNAIILHPAVPGTFCAVLP